MKKLIKSYLKTDFGIALLVTLGWQTLIAIIGIFITVITKQNLDLLSHTNHWDAGWYTIVANGGYATNAASPAFYPLFPLVVNTVRLVTFNSISLLEAGQIVNFISVWFVIAALLKIGRILLNNDDRKYLIVILLAFPTAYFMHVFYSEALFMALGFWAYYLSLRSKWLNVGILLAIITAARLPGIIFVGLCLLEFARQYDWNIKNILNKNLLYFLLAPFGFIAYALSLQIIRGDILAMFHAYHATNDWTYQVFNINFFSTILTAFYRTSLVVFGLIKFNKDTLVNLVLPFISLVILGISSVYLIFQKNDIYKPLGLIGIPSIILFTLNSNVVSIHRYVLPCLSIYVAAVLFFKNKKLLFILCAFGIVVQMYLYILFISNVFSG